MKKSKFITLLRTLDKQELPKFHKYLRQNHPNEGAALAVFEYVQKYCPELKDEKKLAIGYAYQKIFKKDMGESKANRLNMLNALSDLHIWLKQFLLLEKVKSDSFEGRTFWMAILKERGLMPEYSRKAALLQEEVEKMPKASIPDYMKGMVANYYFYYHLTQDKQKEDIAALMGCASDLDLFYAVSRLKIACEIANRRQLKVQSHGMEPLPAIMALSKTYPAFEHPLLALYIRVYELISSQNGALYPEIESMLKANIALIHPEEVHVVLGYLHNFLAHSMRRGDSAYLAMTHSLNKFTVEHNILSESGGISANHFANIVSVACGVGEVAWANSFIANSQASLPGDLRKDAVGLAEAIVHFEKKEFDEVLVGLREITYHDLLFNIRARSLLLRSYYELFGQKTSVVLDYCVAFETYLKRQRAPKREAVEAARNFIGIVKKLAAGKIGKDAILDCIQHTSPLYHKDWLLEKASLLP
jgi:hypothetical protein